MTLYVDVSPPISFSAIEHILSLTPRLLHYDLDTSRSKQGYPCLSACLYVPDLLHANRSPALASVALRPPSIVLDSCTLTRGWPCLSACLDALGLAPSFSSPSLAPLALRPPSIVLDSCTLTRGWPC